MPLDRRKYSAAVSAGALLAAAGASVQAAAIVEVVIPNEQSGADYDVLFPIVSDATELVSISSGTVYTGEFGTMTISAIFANDQVFPMYSGSFGFPFFVTNPLSQYTNNDFTPFVVPSEVKGVRVDSGGAPGLSATLLLPAGTVLTFAVVPEPTMALLIVCGLFLIAMLRNGWFRRHGVGR